MSGLKLELGKKYVCRNNPAVKYVKIIEYIPQRQYYPYLGEVIYHSGSLQKSSYTVDGRFNAFNKSGSGVDLVAEYIEFMQEQHDTEEKVVGWSNENIDEGQLSEGEAKRYNKDKIALTMFSPIAMLGTCRVLTYGRKKYSDENYDARDNWRKGRGLSLTETVDSLLRHLTLFLAGQERDEESGELHIDHIGCNAMFLQEMVHLGRHKDDNRYVTEDQTAKLKELMSTPVKDYKK